MKRFLLLFFSTIQILAGEPAIPANVSKEWVRFQTALKNDDLPTLIAMIKFPLRCNEFSGDMKSPKAFKACYKTIFPERTKQCFLSSGLLLQREGKQIRYESWCDVGDYPIRFIFKFSGSKLFLTSIDNVNE
jgi:hypothetical protein